LVVTLAYIVRLWYFTPVGVVDYAFITAGIGLTPLACLFWLTAGKHSWENAKAAKAAEYTVACVGILVGVGFSLIEHYAHRLPLQPVVLLVAIGVALELWMLARIWRAIRR
jgi:hypothetical protein